MPRRFTAIIPLFAAAAFFARTPAQAADPGGLLAPADPSETCRPATAQDFAEATQEILGRTIPDRDYYRDEAMHRAGLELEDARKAAKDWDATELEFLSRCHKLKAQFDALEQVRKQLDELQSAPDCEAFQRGLDAVAPALIHGDQDPVLWDVDARLKRWRTDAKQPGFCTTDFSRVHADLRAWAGPIARHVAHLLAERGEQIVLTTQYRTLARKRFTVDALAGHHRALRAAQEKDADDLLAEKTVGKLPWIIVILGVFCLSIMVMVRRFERTVQLEWVRSGQVIQFMTVTIMIIVILALGLSENLNKESLGTLLGTIGGYVLSNGIAERKTAQAVQSKFDDDSKDPPKDPPSKDDNKPPKDNSQSQGGGQSQSVA